MIGRRGGLKPVNPAEPAPRRHGRHKRCRQRPGLDFLALPVDFFPAQPALTGFPMALFVFPGARAPRESDVAMAKAASLKIKLLSTADTGYFYVTKKNARTKTEKFTFTKYDPVARKHVEFKETKIK